MKLKYIKILHTCSVILISLIFSCSPNADSPSTDSSSAQGLKTTIASKDTSWENFEGGPKRWTTSYAKLVNGKIEGDVISKDISKNEIVFVEKYINGVATGEYIDCNSNPLGIRSECKYVKDSALFRIVTYEGDVISTIDYFNLNGTLPLYEVFRNAYYGGSEFDKLVRSLIYYTHDYDGKLIHDGILHTEWRCSQSYIRKKKDIEIILYNDDGTISGKRAHQDGKIVPDGVFELRYGDGSIKSTDSIVNGTYNGMHREYYPSGKIKVEFNKINGRGIGQFKEFYETGQLKTEFKYVDGRIRGWITNYSEFGELINTVESSLDIIDRNIAKESANERRAEEVNKKSYITDGQKCSRCTGYYRGGFCNVCGGASGERVNESYSKAANCEFCGGSGLIEKGGIHGGKKLCSSCKGKGKQIY